jgi:hypothetical protein
MGLEDLWSDRTGTFRKVLEIREIRESCLPYLHRELARIVTISATNNHDVYFQFTYPASSSFCLTPMDATGHGR